VPREESRTACWRNCATTSCPNETRGSATICGRDCGTVRFTKSVEGEPRCHSGAGRGGGMKDLVFVSEVWNPGALPPGLTLEKLRTEHPSIPRNPLIADPLFLAHYIEKAGTGTLAMIHGCRHAGRPEPEFAAPSMCSEVDMEGFMLIRIRHCDKNIASTQQPGISGLRPNRYFICRRFIRQSQPYLGCYADRYKQCWAAECPKSKSGK